MCGIVGAVASRNVVPVLIEGLKMLEYRGYDSAGLAVLNPKLTRVRSVGRVAELQSSAAGTEGVTGIAHTRWATHGVPAERNAHPHSSGHVAVVHNGIIENHDAIRRRLKSEGYEFLSETDTEVIAHLVNSIMSAGAGLYDAVTRATHELEGAYAISVISDHEPHTVVGARKGAPLLIGLGEGENFFASDASALISATNRVIYLDDGDCAELTRDAIRIRDKNGVEVSRGVHESKLSKDAVELGSHKHYMQKEIFEQPGALANTLEMVMNAGSITPQLFGAEAAEVLRDVDSVLILACGTSYHSGVVARYWLEAVAGIRAGKADVVDSARPISEAEYRKCIANGIQPVQFQVASDAVVLAIKNETDVGTDCLSFDEVRNIFRAGSDINSWSQVGYGHDLGGDTNEPRMKVAGPDEDSNVFGFFGQYVLGDPEPTMLAFRSDYQAYPTDAGVRRERRSPGTRSDHCDSGHVSSPRTRSPCSAKS